MTIRRSISITGEVGLHAAPVVAGDVVIVGAAHRAGRRAEEQEQREGLRPRLRRADRQAPVDLPHHSASPASSATTPGKRIPPTTPATPACGARSAWTKSWALAYLPVELPTGDYYGGHRPGNGLFGESIVARRSEDRRAQVALPVGASRHLGHGHSVRADAGRHHRERPHGQGGRAADQAGVPVRVRSRHRASRSGRSRRRPVEQSTVPGEKTSADAAVPDQAAGLRPPGLLDRRPDRLHAGAARRGGEDRRRATRSGRSSRRRS